MSDQQAPLPDRDHQIAHGLDADVTRYLNEIIRLRERVARLTATLGALVDECEYQFGNDEPLTLQIAKRTLSMHE